MNWMKKGILLGLAFFVAILVIKPIGVSTQYSVLSGIVDKIVRPSVIWEDENQEYGYSSSNEYYNKEGGKLAAAIEHPWNYGFVFVLAIPLGGFIGSLIYKKEKDFKEQDNPCRIEKRSWAKEYLPSFFSGFLLLYGARMADGCTSGHMMSGMMQGSLSGYLFAASVFAVAIPMAIIVGKIRRRRRG